MSETIVVSVALLVTAIVLIVVILRLRKLHAEHSALVRTHSELVERFRPIVDVDAERRRVLGEIEELRAKADASMAQARAEHDAERQRWSAESAAEREGQRAALARIRAEHEQALANLLQQRTQTAAELEALQAKVEALRQEFRLLDEESNLQSFGFYKPRYAFSDSGRYQAKLEEIRGRQKMMLKDKKAAYCAIEWTVNGSKSEGKKQIGQTLRLMLRAFNGECDATIAKVKYNNIKVMESRILKAYEAINGLAQVQQCKITPEYLNLKLEELYLVFEYEEKVQEETLEQRRIREQMREEEIALRELEKARQEAERDEQRFAEAIRKAREDAERASGAKQQKLLAQIAELERKLAEAHANKERAISRAQMTRSGHVYVISNIGSFGEHVYKIGMTRRLDPMDRVRELGDASVPFEFDVHAIIYSEDAPALENQLHRALHHRRVNRINERKEFFRVELHEIIEIVRRHHSAEVEFVHRAEAAEFRKTLALLADEKSASMRRPAAGPSRAAALGPVC